MPLILHWYQKLSKLSDICSKTHLVQGYVLCRVPSVDCSVSHPAQGACTCANIDPFGLLDVIGWEQVAENNEHVQATRKAQDEDTVGKKTRKRSRRLHPRELSHECYDAPSHRRTHCSILVELLLLHVLLITQTRDQFLSADSKLVRRTPKLARSTPRRDGTNCWRHCRASRSLQSRNS